MYVSQTVAKFLDRHGAEFDVITHRPTRCSSETARCAHIPSDALAKGVVLCMGYDLLMAVVPASRRVDPNRVASLLHDGPPALAAEDDLPFVFRDCAFGAVPVTGPAFGLPTLVDESLLRRTDIYFEGGDHEHLVHMKGGEFVRLMTGQPHGAICC